MKFTTRTLYGLRAVLVLASRFGEGSLSVSQIAKKESISAAYLEQILNSLKKKGFVKSVRGPQGGYVLSKKPSEIHLDALLAVLDNKNSPDFNGELTVASETDEISIANLIFWKKFKLSIETGLSKVTLKDLIDEARSLKKKKLRSNYAFNI